MRFLLTCAALLALTLLCPITALAADAVPAPNDTLALPAMQFWALVLGAIVPAVTYVLNYHAPWASEKIKAAVLVVASAAVGAIYQQLTAGDLALDTETLQMIGTAVVGALLAHLGFYKPSGLNSALGGGRNASAR